MSCTAWKWAIIVTAVPLVAIRLWWMLPRYWDADESQRFVARFAPYLRYLALMMLVCVVGIAVFAIRCD